MEAFLISTGIVALAEIGDKTQLLALVLAARYRRPVPIILGILVATLANHAMAGAAGAWISALVGPTAMRWILGISFIAMAVWTLIPDKLDDDEDGQPPAPKFGVFGTTLVAFFLLEMGLVAASRFGELRRAGPFLVIFAIVMPLFSAGLGVATGGLLGLSVGGVTLLATLYASASYIAAPAAMRLAVPQANPALSIGAALGVTFPFNVLVGIPLYHAMTTKLFALTGG
jgi:hypothetical protein